MSETTNLLAGVGIGAGLMYLLDPDRGRARRARLRDQAMRLAHETREAAGVVARDLSQRTYGLVAEGRSRFSTEPVSDAVLCERVRSHIGRAVSHPGALEVTARDGRVTLSGPVLANEVEGLLACAWAVPGVRAVQNRLDVHRQPGNVPGLQGGPSSRRAGGLTSNWTPTTRALVGGTGGALLVFGLTQRAPLACVLGTAGLGLFVRGLTNLNAERLIGLGGGRRVLDVQKTLTIHAPVEQVFGFWANYENFPRFMAHVREVRNLGHGRSHWVVTGPGGVPVTWDAVVTRFEPNAVLAWKSEPGSVIANAGIIHFERQSNDATRVNIRFTYNPPAGALGHVAALLFGADPKSQMDEDLMRLKSLLEEGKTRAPGKHATAEAVGAAPAPATRPNVM